MQGWDACKYRKTVIHLHILTHIHSWTNHTVPHVIHMLNVSSRLQHLHMGKEWKNWGLAFCSVKTHKYKDECEVLTFIWHWNKWLETPLQVYVMSSQRPCPTLLWELLGYKKKKHWIRRHMKLYNTNCYFTLYNYYIFLILYFWTTFFVTFVL